MNAPVATAEPPRAGFMPVTPIGNAPVLSLVPPAMQGDHVVHPEPVSTVGVEQQPLPTSPAIPVAPVRRRRPVTPLISLPSGAPLGGVMQVAPLMPGQPVSSPQIQPTPAAYGLLPTTFPFMAAPAFQLAPQFYGMLPQPMPAQTFVAFVTLAPVVIPMAPQPIGPSTWQAPQPPR